MIAMTRDRRHFLAEAAALIGLAVLPGDALLAASPPRPVPDSRQFALVAALADTLIPRTDTPGAIDAGVPATFARLLDDWAKPQTAADLRAALTALDEAAKTEAGQSFAQSSKKRRTAFLTAYDAKRFKSDAAYTKLKLLLVTLYYLSEPGATKDLRYEHAPGVWEASTPVTAQTRTWASAGFG